MPLLAHTPSVAHLVVRVIPHLGCDNLTYSSSSNRPPVRQQYDFAESVGAIMAEDEKKEACGSCVLRWRIVPVRRSRPSASGGRTATVFNCDGRGHIQATFKQAILPQGSRLSFL